MTNEEQHQVRMRHTDEISDDEPSQNKAVQIIEIDSKGSVTDDLLFVSESALESLKSARIDLKEVVEDYAMTLMLHNEEIRQELIRWNGEKTNGTFKHC